MDKEFVLFLLSLSVTEYRAVKRAIQVLRRSGIDLDDAASIIINARMQARQFNAPRMVAK